MSGPQPDEPNYFVLIAPGADSSDPTPSWEDVSTDLRSVNIIRGADKHLDEDQPGEATIVLDNYLGTYDNDNSGSPYFGQLVTDMRVRVLAEWDGELHERFNGYLDDIDLEYPDGDTQAWAVLHATDAFKVLAGADLPSSVYVAEVETDNPTSLWRLNEPQDAATAFDSAGSNHLAYLDGPTLGQEGLVVHEPGTSAQFSTGFARAERAGNIITGFPFTIEAVFRTSGYMEIYTEGYTVGASGAVLELYVNGGTGQLIFLIAAAGASAFLQIISTQTVNDDETHHVAISVTDATTAVMYIDGATETPSSSTFSGGSIPTTTYKTMVGNYAPNLVNQPNAGLLQTVAVYPTALSASRVAAHNDAARTPWNGDSPGQRAHRIADLIGWPALLRDFDDGESTLQATELAMTALDHLLKVAASEFGELHVSKEGAIMLRSRDSLINRDPLAEFGPSTNEVRYRTIRFSSGADLVRNPVTVSRLDGAAQTAAAPATHYPHQFTLDGLYHDSDELSRSAADFLLSEFKDQKRRIAGLTFGPFEADRLNDWFPLLLEAELGDVYQVTFAPPNGDDLVQISVLEGTEETWDAESGIGEMTWQLSRAYAGGSAFWQLGVHGRSELGVTTRLYF